MEKAAARGDVNAHSLQTSTSTIARRLAGNGKLLAMYAAARELSRYRRAMLIAQGGVLPVSTREPVEIVERSPA